MPKPSRVLTCLVSAVFASAFVRAHDGDPKLIDKVPAYQGRGWRNVSLAPRRADSSANANARAVAAPRPGGTSALAGLVFGAAAASAAASTPPQPLALSAPPVAFPANGVTLLAWLPLPEFGITAGGNANSCWGYTSPSGREYALLGLSNGTAFVEITQPGNPVLVAQVTGPTSLWRDMKTYSHYAYAISEGGGGIQVIDLANIDSGSVSLVATVNDDATSTTHTLAVDTVSGYLYRSGGGSNGLRIYDVHTNPALPARVGTWSARYVHEPSVFVYTSGPAAGKQIAFCCGGFSGGFNSTGLYVVDVTNKAAPVLLTYVPYTSSSFAHQAWPSDDLNWLYLDDELDDKNLGVTSVTRVFDISDPANASYVTSFTSGSTAIDHNQYVRGDKIYQSNYRSGLRVFQTSAPGTPTAPVQIASFDTWPEDDQTFFNGLWNNYPFFPSGVVIGSDIEKGLFVWWVGAPQLTFSVVGGVPETLPPSGDVLRVSISGALQAGTPAVNYDLGAGFVSAPMLQASNGDWLATLPPSPCGTPVSVFFSAQSTNGIVWTDPPGGPEQCHVIASSFARATVASNDFEGSITGWTIGASGDTATGGVWERGVPFGNDLAPSTDHSVPGTQCFVTQQGLAGNPVGTADVDGGATSLTSPAFALAGNTTARIAYWRWYKNQLATGSAPDDVFRVRVSNNGSTWVDVETLGPQGVDCRGGWIRHEFRVADFVTPTNNVRVRFVASDTNADTHVEAAIDDVRVTTDTCSGGEAFCAGDGSFVDHTTPCPCGNSGVSGNGCAHSFNAAGASLSATGSPAADNVVLATAGEPATSFTLFLQHDAAGDQTFHDGVLCAGGTLVRLRGRAASAGQASFPNTLFAEDTQTLAQRGGVTAGGGALRYYAAWFRNASTTFCPPATANVTNGWKIVW